MYGQSTQNTTQGKVWKDEERRQNEEVVREWRKKQKSNTNRVKISEQGDSGSECNYIRNLNALTGQNPTFKRQRL